MAIKRSLQGGTPFGTTANRPANPAVGQTYYNGTLGYLEMYTAAGWAAAAKAIPFGNTAARPANPVVGEPYFNGQEARLELYTSNGWQNIVQETPSVVSIVGQLNESATSTLTINGTNFATGAIAYVVGTNGVETVANTTTLVSVVEITAVFPALPPANAPYDVKVVNTSNLYGVLYETLGVNDNPVWSTSAGSLGTFTELDVVSVTVAATDATDSTNSPLQYSLVSGSLPTGFSLNSTTGVISGTAVNVATNTTYSFTIGASDSRNTVQTRAFSITINDRSPVWTTSSTLPIFTKNVAYSTTVSATEDESGAITYSLVSGSLPTGLTLSSAGVISGTPTSSINASFTIRATVTASGNTTDRAFTMANAIPVWVTTSIPSARNTGDAYSTTLNATDDGTVNISLISGTLPSGFSYNPSTKIISGSSVTTSSTSLTFRATDDNGSFVDQTMTFSVQAPTIVSITSSQAWVAPTGVSLVDLFMVGGGGSSGITAANGYSGGGTGGGGGGGTVFAQNITVVPGTSYSIVVGGGGAKTPSNNPSDGPSPTPSGSSSTAFSRTAFGGNGAPGSGYGAGAANGTGGPGGGGSNYSDGQVSGGQGNGNISQGGAGGDASGSRGGGGGGAGGAGATGSGGGNGGTGVTQFSVTLGGGGGGGGTDGGGTGGSGGGASGVTGFIGTNATANTGGGGGGIRGGNGSSDPYNESGGGGSGRVIIRYFG
jgi:hypothetical protein